MADNKKAKKTLSSSTPAKSAAAKKVSSPKPKAAAKPAPAKKASAPKTVAPAKAASKKTAAPAAKTPAKKAAPVKAAKTKSAPEKPSAPAKKSAAKAAPKKEVPAKKEVVKKVAPAKEKAPKKVKAVQAEPPQPKEEKSHPGEVKYAPDRSPVLSSSELAKQQKKQKEDAQKIREISEKVHFDSSVIATLDQNEINARMHDLRALSNQQGYVTIEDINNTIPATTSSPEAFEKILDLLANLDIKILENDDVAAYKTKLTSEEEEALRSVQVDILDDPVRMYLRQMGQVPLLNRDQEISIDRKSVV